MKNENIKSIFRPSYYYIKLHLKRIREILFAEPLKNNREIPIIINNYNRLSYLIQMISWLEKYGYTNIYIIDNNSTYQPLIEFYNQCKYPIYRLKQNIGYLALWKTGIYKRFYKSYYVYTDPDLAIVDECPPNFIDQFVDLLQRYKYSSKAGFSLKIDDIPDYYPKKAEVIDWETQFWVKTIEDNIFAAPIDTTFAVYRPFTKWGANFYEGHMRVGFPFQVRHLPWYTDNKMLTEEDVFYTKSTTTRTHWTKNENV